MNRFRAILIPLPVIISLTFFTELRTTTAASTPQGNDIVKFHWAFGALVGPKSNRQLVAIKRDTTLQSGDEIQMFIELQTKSFVYVLYRSPQDELSLLFPYDLKQYDTEPIVRKRYYIPVDRWLEFDESIGHEYFYLLAATWRLTDFEALIHDYTAAGHADQPALARQMVAEIHRMRRDHRNSSQPAERPVTIGGNVRGVRPDIAHIAVEISAEHFYGRTFTIDHQ